MRHGVLAGLAHTRHHTGDRPGRRKARLLLETLDTRRGDVLRFAHDLKVPPTPNRRPSKHRRSAMSLDHQG